MISFVVPALNEEARIGACVASIVADAGNYDHEIIVVDNGCGDDTVGRAVAAGADLVPSERHRGVPAARRTGFDWSSGDVIAFVDADAVLPAGWTRAMLVNFEDPRVVAVSGPLQFYDGSRFVNAASRCFYLAQRAAHHVFPTLQGGNYAVRRSALIKTQGFDTSIEFWGEDTATAARLARVGKIVLDPAMVMQTSARRLARDGVAKTVGLYVLNYLAVSVTGKPLTRGYHNVR